MPASKTKSITKKEILEAIKSMSVIDLSDLVKDLEEVFGVSASASLAVAVAPVAAAEEATATDEEKTDFKVTLQEIGDKKINVIKAVREVTTLGLKEAKDLVEAAPSVIKESVGKEESDQIKQKVEAAGGKVSIE